MEGIAARGGVSKALPYRHFDNADDVLMALYQREMALLAERVTARLELEPVRLGEHCLQSSHTDANAHPAFPRFDRGVGE